MNLFRSFRNSPTSEPNVAVPARLTLVRTFVETGDERCPIAGIWSRLAEPAAPTDDPELPSPIVGVSLPRWAFIAPWAFHLRFNVVRYSSV